MRQRPGFFAGASILPNSGKNLCLDRCQSTDAFTAFMRQRPGFFVGASILPNSGFASVRIDAAVYASFFAKTGKPLFAGDA